MSHQEHAPDLFHLTLMKKVVLPTYNSIKAAMEIPKACFFGEGDLQKEVIALFRRYHLRSTQYKLS